MQLLLLTIVLHGTSLSPAMLADAPMPAAVTPPPLPSIPSKRAEPLHPLAVGCLQSGAGCGLLCAAMPVSVICPPVGWASCLGVPYVETWIGDQLGGSRAPVIWPLVGGLVGLIAATVVAVPVNLAFMTIFVGTQALALVLSGDLVIMTAAVLPLIPLALGLTLVLAVFQGAVFGIGAATGYAIGAQPKDAEDDGSGLPGLFAPAAPNRSIPPPTSAPEAPVIGAMMRY